METIISSMVEEAINNEIYDLMDELSTSELEQCVIQLVHGLQKRKSATAKLGKYFVKARNSEYGSTISVSDDYGTAVSETLTCLLPSEAATDTLVEHGYVTEMISMINEAWFTLQ